MFAMGRETGEDPAVPTWSALVRLLARYRAPIIECSLKPSWLPQQQINMPDERIFFFPFCGPITLATLARSRVGGHLCESTRSSVLACTACVPHARGFIIVIRRKHTHTHTNTHTARCDTAQMVFSPIATSFEVEPRPDVQMNL